MSYCTPSTNVLGEGGGEGYYGFVVVTPRPQTFHRSHNNLKHPYRIAFIFCMQIEIGEWIAGKQDGPGPIIYGPPRAPE